MLRQSNTTDLRVKSKVLCDEMYDINMNVIESKPISPYMALFLLNHSSQSTSQEKGA